MDPPNHYQAGEMIDPSSSSATKESTPMTPMSPLPSTATQGLSVLNATPQPLPGPAFLHRLIRDDSPHGVPALDYRDADGVRRAVSYAELHKQADRFASRILVALAGEPQEGQLIVPLLLPQCPELYISQLAVLKAGGAFCPLNLDAPPERVRFILGDVAARVVVTNRALRSKIDALGSGVVVVVVGEENPDELLQDNQDQDRGRIVQDIHPENLAYVMYTSGSTGTPKGVGISHDAATQALLAHDRHIPHFSRFLQFAAPTFDVSVFEIFFPLLRGATLVCCNRADMLNDLPAMLRDLEVDACELTPTVAGSLLRSRINAPNLRLLLTIGEMLTEPVIREFGGDENKTSILWAMYGPTEATIHCTLQPACHSSSSPNNVGFPLDTVSAFVLQPLPDDGNNSNGAGEFAVLPMGEMGELAVGGFQTAIGYIKRPEQTSKVFIDTPYGRLYRTGDKARFKEDGTIECFGRISDGQVKLRGQRIELGEIEQAVLRAPGCHGAVAAVIRGIIMVFCETDAQDDCSRDRILQICGEWLPAYMVPSDVVLLNDFPRLSSGKVDRKQLKLSYEESQSNEVDSSNDDYQDDVEQQLAQIVQDVLGIKLRSTSTLSAVGIDSLASIRLASHLRSAGFAVTAVDILNSQSLASLRSTMRNREQSTLEETAIQFRAAEEDAERIANLASVLGVQADVIEAVAPCTPTQLSMLGETLGDPKAYCNWIELEIPEAHSFETIVSWFQTLARCHEALRTGFVAYDGVYNQVVWKDLDGSLIKDVKTLTRQYQLDDAGFVTPFCVQVQVSETVELTTILLQIHHALYDGWSFDILLADLNLLARGESVCRRPPFRRVSRYYSSSDFARHADLARGYWAEHLLGHQPSPMPQLLSQYSQTSQRLSTQAKLSLQASDLHSITSLLDISPQVLFQACLLWLWAYIHGSDDVVIGNITSGRTIPVDGIEDVVGPCLTSIPLRAKLGQVRTIRDLLQSIHATNRESLVHCALPLVDIKKAAGIPPGQALYNALFVYQESIPSRSLQRTSGSVRQVAHEDYLETKLLVEVEPIDGRFQLRVTCHTDAFHPDHVQLLMQQFDGILTHIVRDSALEIGTISTCFSDNLLSTYNVDHTTLQGCCDLASLFEATAARHPEKEAICFAESIEDGPADLETIRYGQLNNLANKIAWHLKTLGVEEGQSVAIIMEKSIMLYAGIMAILKTGCAYLPMLPSTPKARIHTILTQANVSLSISDDITADALPEPVACQFVSLCTTDLQDYSCENLGTNINPTRPANIIYTSGSTGVPKGVCVTQLNICSNLDVLSRIYPVKDDSRMLQVCSQAFDVSVFEILFSFTRGMCLCSGTNDTLFADLERSINTMKVTHLSMTTTVASLVNPVNVPQVEFLVTSGEPMTAEVAKKWVGKLYQGYGPSETTNICSVKKMTFNDHIRHLGYTFENTSATVLAPNSMNILPIGCVGEFCFGGDQVVAGYLNLPLVTQEKFIMHPKLGRIYRSGDMGRMLADGSLLIVGRIDDQIKLRGQRIELGEVNSVVAMSSVVSNCVTLLVNLGDGNSSQQLACFYVLKSTTTASENGDFQLLPASARSARDNEDIFRDLRSRLPGYMVPSYLVPISSIPMTSSGKVDKAKLRNVFSSLGPKELEALSPSAGSMAAAAGDCSDEELKIATLLASTLKVPIHEIGRWTPLTSMGLDSISAISVSKRLQEVFVMQKRLPISVILQGPSVARLAMLLREGHVEQQQSEATVADTNKSLQIFSSEFVETLTREMAQNGVDVEAILPCTPLQEAMLASSARSSSYLNKMLLRLNGDSAAPAVTAMKEYWSVMFRRHGILRTCFFTTSDREHAVAQCVLKQWEPEWVDYDVHGFFSLDDAISKHVEAVPAAIDSGIPPISLALIRATDGGDDEKHQHSYLSFICHHAMYDGVAISQLLKEIEMVVSGVQLAQQPAPSYEPFLQEMLALPADTDDFWAEHLRDARFKDLPRASSEPASLSVGRDSLVRALDTKLSCLEANLKTLNVSMLSLLQASWGVLLHIISQSEDVCFGNVVSGRSVAVDGVEELVAPCFNTIPTRICFGNHDDPIVNGSNDKNDSTNRPRQRRKIDVLKFFQALNPQLLQYQFTPLRRIQQAVTRAATTKNHVDKNDGNGSVRLFDTLLLLQQPPRPLDEALWALERDDGEMDFPLVCEVTPREERDELELRLHFDRSHVSNIYAAFVYDTLCYIISTFTEYSFSRVISRSSLPSSLRDRLEALHLVHETGESKEGSSSGQSALNGDWSESESVVRSVLSEISNTPKDRITRNITIFRLGLDSINAIQIAAMLRKQGFAVITAADVLENPTCAKLAEKLVQSPSSDEPVTPPLYDISGFQKDAKVLLQDSGMAWDTIQEILPCTPLQIGLLGEFVASRGDAYLNFISFQFENGITATAVRDAWLQVAERFDMLRAGFVPLDHKDSTYAMVLYKFNEAAVPVHIQDRDFELTAWRKEAARAVFENLRQPSWQLVLVDNKSSGTEMHLAIHHVLYDAHSLQTMFSGLAEALRRKTSSADDNSNTSTSDAVRNIITHTQQRAQTTQPFWETHAANAVVNKFPVMTPLREDQREILVRSRVSALSQSALDQAVKNTGFTIQAVAQAAWLRILSSYLGEPSVVFGTILSGRDLESTRNAAFPCITTLPVIGQNASSNRELVEAMMEYNVRLQRHQWTPLTHVQRWLGHPNTKLFDTLLVYQKSEHNNQDANATRPWRMIDEHASVDYPVSLEIEPQHDTVELRLTFFTDILPREQAELLLAQFDAVFCNLVQRPDEEEDDLFKTRQDLFAILAAAEPELNTEIRFLHEFVEVSTQAHSEKTALQFVSAFQDDKPISREWTYSELNENGNKVANMLAPHVAAGDIVAVYFDKCPEAHFAMLGILKAGCALLALDPGAPSARKEFILQDSGAAVLLTDKARSLDLGFDISVPVLSVDEDALLSASPAPPVLTRPLTPQDRSYCLYTSGTTGTPKGCEITHENAVQAMLAFQVLFEGHWDPTSKWLQFASYHFDVSVLEQYWTWSVGIALVAAPRDVILEDLAGTISRLEITHIDLTPSLARLIHPDEVPSLCRGVFITGGEQLKQEILDAWGPKRVIHNFYGPTEATIGVTTFSCVPENGRSSNIGKQFPNVGSFVLKPETDIPVLRGGVGELCVSGKLVGKGYLNRTELTDERFPTLASFGERVYRTGDLVRVLHDGCFDFLGRADDQVKLRGQRLEIGEINHCIKTGVDGVTDVVTLVIRNEKQQKDLLVSFVVTTQHQKTKALDVIGGEEAASIGQKVQIACREKLPGYMVPTYVLLLPFIPLSPNNKAEFKALRALFNGLSPEQLVAPSAAVSGHGELDAFGRKLCRALSNMAGISEGEFSASTNIFELGVDSISAIRLVTALKREGVKHASPAIILRNPTVGDLAQALKSTHTQQEGHKNYSASDIIEAKQAVEACQHRHRGAICRALRITPQQVEYIAPCSALQQGMISRSRTEDKTGAYFNTFRFQLVENVSLSKLRAAWEQLVAENSVLRTRFVSTTEGFVQVALKDFEAPWMEIEPESQNDDDLDELLEKHRKSWVEANNSWNIDAPLEFLTVSRGDGRRLLVVHIFHAIYDANSFELMLDEVARLYQGQEATQAPTFLDALLHGPLKNHSSSKAFWVEHLRAVSFGPTPPTSETPSQEPINISRQVSFKDLDKIRIQLGVTHQALVQALWSIALQEYLGTSITFGIIVSGRSFDLDNVDRAIGPLFNTVPYHHRCMQGQTWAAAVRQCHEFNTAILPFQHVPLRDVQKWCSGGKPLFDSLFSFQRAASVTDPADREGLWREIESHVNPDYPLALEATLLPGGVLQVLVVTSRGFSDQESLNKLLDTFEKHARAIGQDVDRLVLPNAHHASASDASQHIANGCYETASEPTCEIADYEWTPQSTAIRNEMALLADVEVLTVTPKTSLLELGLDSIDTIKLSARLRRVGILLTNSELIKGQSIAELVVTLQNKEAAEGEAADSGYSSEAEDPSTPLKRYFEDKGHGLVNVQDILPPTPLQDSMVSEMIQSDFRRYFNHDVLELPPSIDLTRLKSAWQTVIKNSSILRTVFAEVQTSAFEFTFAQLVLGDFSLKIHETDIASLDDTAELMELARTRALAGRGSSNLLQLTFAKVGGKAYVLFSIAHALYDGWSLGLLHQDVEAAYRGTYAPRQAYTEHLGEIIRSSRHESRDFWSDYVSGATPAIFPSRSESLAAEPKVNKAEIAMRVSAATLKAFCKRHAISQQAVAQVCWAAVLATHCQRLDVTFGVVLSGRDSEASEAMLFPTMNTVPVRAVLHGSSTAFLRYMQENMTNINQFQHFPLRKIQAMVPHRQGGQLFNTLFILQKGAGTAPYPSGDESSEPFVKSVIGSSAVEYPVCVEMEVEGERVVWRTACDDAYLTTTGTQNLLEELDSVLSFLVGGSESDMLKVGEDGVSICGLPSFRPQEQAQSITTQGGEIQPEEEGGDGEEWSSTEAVIRSVLAEVSDTAEVSIKKCHSIYHLGLDSISAIKVSTMLRKRGIAVTVREMIQAASVRDIAAKASYTQQTSPLVSNDGNTTTSGELVAAISKAFEGIQVDEHLRVAGIPNSGVEELLPATAMQTHMLSVWQNTNGLVFFTEFRYRVSGIRDAQAIEHAWRALVEHHAILRTVFIATGSDVTPFLQAVLRCDSTTENPFWAFDVQQDKASGGGGDNKWIVSLRLHHALYDGVSLPLIMGDFKKLLSKPEAGIVSQSAQDLATWKRLIASSVSQQAVHQRRSFWEEYLKDPQFSPLESHTATTNKNDAEASAAERVILLRRAALSDLHSLKSLCSQHGVSIQALFLAAYAKAFASSSTSCTQTAANDGGAHDVIFGVYLANRSADLGSASTANEQRCAALPFPRLCLVPLRVRIASRAASILELAVGVQRDLYRISAPENVTVGLWEIQAWTGVRVDSFVNFLSLPGGETEENTPTRALSEGSHGGEIASRSDAGVVRMEEVGFDVAASPREKSIVAGLTPLRWLEANAVKDAYPDAVDVEVALQPNGAMDIGVFGSRGKLGDAGAEKLVARITEIMHV